jgi:DNA anti-recombination protein RmuC
MRFCLTGTGVALVTAALLLTAVPASAKSAQSQENSLHQELESFAAALKAHSERAMAAAAEAARGAIEDNKDKIDDVKSDFTALLNEQKARLGIIGEDAAAKFDAWTQAAVESWAEMHHSALEALDRLQDWLERQSVSDEPIRV